MARVTVEDCVEKVEDRFELVALAAQRAKNIVAGAPLTIERNNEKDTVIALREIADENVDPVDLREDLVKSHQRFRENDDAPVDDVISLDDAALRQLATEEQEASAPLSEEQEVEEAAEEAAEALKTDDMMFAEDNIEVDD